MTIAVTRPRFTSEQAREAGKRSAAARAAKRELERAEAHQIAQRKAEVARLVDAFDTVELGKATLAAVMELAKAAVQGEIPVPENALERKRLAETAEILHRIARLELGESTSNAMHVSVDASQLDARADALRAELATIDAQTVTSRTL